MQISLHQKHEAEAFVCILHYAVLYSDLLTRLSFSLNKACLLCSFYSPLKCIQVAYKLPHFSLACNFSGILQL